MSFIHRNMPSGIFVIVVIALSLLFLVGCGGSSGGDSGSSGGGSDGGNSGGSGGQPSPVPEQEKTQWQTARTGFNAEIVDVAFSGEQYIAVTEEGYFNSVDGVQWDYIPGSDKVTWVYRPQKIHYLNEQFVTVGSFFNIKFSKDGINWKSFSLCSAVSSDCLGHLNAVASNGLQYVTAGDGGHVYYSEEGSSWVRSAINLSDSDNILDIRYANNRYVAVGVYAGDRPLIMHSSNGIDWNFVTLGESFDRISEVLWNGNEFVALGSKNVYKSFDGISWVQSKKSNAVVNSVNWNGNRYYAVCSLYDLCVSDDAITWVNVADDLPRFVSSRLRLFPDQDRLFLVGQHAESAFIATHKLSNIQQFELSFSTWNFETITANNETFYAVDRDCNIFSSSDIKTWNFFHQLPFQTSSPCADVDLLWVEDLSLFIMSSSADIQTSTDMKNWQRHISYTTQYTGHGTNAMVWTGDKIIVVGIHENIYTSSDGSSWERIAVDGAILYSVAWSPSLKLLVAVGQSGKLMTSADGVAWNTLEAVTTETIRDVVFYKDRFIAVGDNNLMMESLNGVDWSVVNRLKPAYNTSLRNLVVSGSSVYLLSGYKMYRSDDGENWVEETTENGKTLLDSAANTNGIVAVGQSGTIVYKK